MARLSQETTRHYRRAVRHFEVVEVSEGAAYLLHGEDLVDGGKRREQEELLPWLVAKGCAEEHHRIDEAVARFFWLNAGFRYYAHDFIVLRHHPGDNRRITRNYCFLYPI